MKVGHNGYKPNIFVYDPVKMSLYPMLEIEAYDGFWVRLEEREEMNLGPCLLMWFGEGPEDFTRYVIDPDQTIYLLWDDALLCKVTRKHGGSFDVYMVNGIQYRPIPLHSH